jgi:adenosylcobinamide kinase/adenosylcobinamide-phosphate guanylyltransferase
VNFARSAEIILVTGPTRSGKSEWAESLAMQSQKAVFYVPTAQVQEGDREWQDRIQRHIDRRPPNWQTHHAPFDLVAVFSDCPSDCCLLIDSLGTWVANLLEREDADWDKALETLLAALTGAQQDVILVAEETGWGVVPAYPLGRKFRDRLGDLIRKVGAIADRVYLVVGGYAVDLAQIGTRIN